MTLQKSSKKIPAINQIPVNKKIKTKNSHEKYGIFNLLSKELFYLILQWIVTTWIIIYPINKNNNNIIPNKIFDIKGKSAFIILNSYYNIKSVF